jgi:hypothetical protein
MICYICHKETKECFNSGSIKFGFCEEHQYDVLKGVAKFVQTKDLSYLNKLKEKNLDYEATTDQAFD